MKFDWDIEKAKTNLQSHDVSFEEATFVFSDIWAIQEFDDAHSDLVEKRFTVIGLSQTRLLRVTYTIIINLKNDEIIRLISAREAKGLDKIDYERNFNESNR
jgi:uncharacterized protein